ncbi:MAG: TolC family protein, partial [Thioalkalispiraceae bacterium]
PSQSLNLDLNYRVPLGRGENNTIYQQAKTIAELQQRIEQLNEKNILKSLVEQVINLFYEIENNERRLQYTESSIDRSRRLKNYIARNMQLGIYENKDVLEAQAQLLKVISEKETLALAVSEQKNALRKLLGLEPGSSLELAIEKVISMELVADQLLAEAEGDAAELQIKQRQLEISDARIISALNENSDQKDIVFSVGARTLYGDSTTESVSEEDYAAQLKFEYNYDLGKKSYKSNIEKIKKDKDIALQEIRLNKDEIRYRLNALLDKIQRQEKVLQKLTRHMKVSEEKYNDALQRHRKGRINTTDLIGFENDLHLASLDYSSASINLSLTKMNLALFTGRLWNTLGIETGLPGRSE